MITVTADPGVDTGLVLWPDLRQDINAPLCHPIEIATCSMPHVGFWELRARVLFDRIMDYMAKWKPECLIVEDQALWGGKLKSYTAGVQGDLFKLSHVAGMLLAGGYMYGCVVRLIPVITWKGQLPKSVTKARCMKFCKDEFMRNSHVADAVGMGYSIQGVLKGDSKIWPITQK